MSRLLALFLAGVVVLGMVAIPAYAQDDKVDNLCAAGGAWAGLCNQPDKPALTNWNYTCGYAFAHYQNGDWTWKQVFDMCKVTPPAGTEVICGEGFGLDGFCYSPNFYEWTSHLPNGEHYAGGYYETTTQEGGCPNGTTQYWWDLYNTYICVE
jgi:hypothetical protein